ncbi:MAG: hypothetical protein HY268_13960 [Deltaproteobacteria bacterium]|nr:hypothetical protein [Deltaproteobacteria bacterium]
MVNGLAGRVGSAPYQSSRSGRIFLEGYQHCPPAAGEIVGVTSGGELSWLWQRQGKREEARQLLAEIYDWFTEGFDTKDLQEAKAMLEELAY